MSGAGLSQAIPLLGSKLGEEQMDAGVRRGEEKLYFWQACVGVGTGLPLPLGPLLSSSRLRRVGEGQPAAGHRLPPWWAQRARTSRVGQYGRQEVGKEGFLVEAPGRQEPDGCRELLV